MKCSNFGRGGQRHFLSFFWYKLLTGRGVIGRFYRYSSIREGQYETVLENNGTCEGFPTDRAIRQRGHRGCVVGIHCSPWCGSGCALRRAAEGRGVPAIGRQGVSVRTLLGGFGHQPPTRHTLSESEGLVVTHQQQTMHVVRKPIYVLMEHMNGGAGDTK